jgi:hypothetical protein
MPAVQRNDALGFILGDLQVEVQVAKFVHGHTIPTTSLHTKSPSKKRRKHAMGFLHSILIGGTDRETHKKEGLVRTGCHHVL